MPSSSPCDPSIVDSSVCDLSVRPSEGEYQPEGRLPANNEIDELRSENGWQSEHGYTLVEVAVAIGVSFIIVGLVYSTYLMASRVTERWHAGLRLENELHQTSVQLTRDVYRA